MADNPALFFIQKNETRDQPFQVFVFDTSQEDYILRAYSETYAERAGAVNMVDAVQAGTTDYETFVGSDGLTYWHVKSADNGKVLARSARGNSEIQAIWEMSWLQTHASGAAVLGRTA